VIEHQIEWLMSEAWGVESDDHALDFARRVDEFLEAQQYETGLGSLDLLPDIVQEVYGRARAPKVPWKDVFRKALEETIAGANKPEDGVITPILPKPLTNRFISIVPDTSGSMSPKDARLFLDDYPFCSPDEGRKSDFIKSLAEKEGIEVEEIKMSPPSEHPEDWLGIPITSEEHREELRAKLDSGEIGHHRAMFFFDEYISMPRDKYEAMIAINKAMNPERDNGEQSERND
jgi:hypothetical protein